MLAFFVILILLIIIGFIVSLNSEDAGNGSGKEWEAQRAAQMREEEKERKRRERERVAAIAREQRALEKELAARDKRISKIENQLENPSTFRELSAALSNVDQLDMDDRRFLFEQSDFLYPQIRRVQKDGAEQRLIDYMDEQFDSIRKNALLPIGIEEFAQNVNKIIKPFETNCSTFPDSVKAHYVDLTGELFGRWSEK